MKKIPYLLIESEEYLFNTLQIDGSEEFIVSINPFFNCDIWCDKEKKDIIYDFFSSSFEQYNKNYKFFYSHNIVSNKIKNIINILHKKAYDTKDPKIFALLNYLLLSHSFSTHLFEIHCSNLFTEKLTEDNLLLLNELYKTDSSLLYKNDELDIKILSNKVNYKKGNIFTIGMIIEELKELNDNIYYAIEIYGKKNYVLLHPFIKEIESITSIPIEHSYCTILGEYNNAIAQLFSY